MKRAVVVLFFYLSAIRLGALELFVSPAGNDANAGSPDAPFATIAQAREKIRAISQDQGLPHGGITVWIAGGIYNQTETLAFDKRDSGTADAPIVYEASPGQEVRVAGAITLDPSWFKQLDKSSPMWSRLDPKARGKVYSVYLNGHGIADYGELRIGGFHIYRVAPLELFVDGKPMTLARWPNKDQPLQRTVSAPSNSRIIYSGSRPERWSQATDFWLHGLWNTPWADFHVEVSSIDLSRKAIILSDPPAQFGIGANQPYYAYNLLEEIDEPGEYYLDRTSGTLYLWPPKEITDSTLQISMLENCLVEMNNVKNVALKGLTLEATRGPLLHILGGQNTVADGCLLRNCGEYGAKVTGTQNGLDGCEIAECGEEGVVLGGGIRSSLTSGNNFVKNCRIHRIARIDWSYHPAIVFVSGCGNLASHNLIEDLPHAAIMFSGNNHIIEFNEIRRVCQRTQDVGAIYAGRDWSYRGNVIRSNFIHDLHSDIEGPGPNGIYLDDGMSGAEVVGNVFYDIEGAATYYGGGRDNITTGNIMARCQLAHCNGDYDRSFINNIPGSPWNFLERLDADDIQYQKEPWLSAYPACAAIPDSWEEIKKRTWRNPEHCVFSNNGGWSNLKWTYETNFSHTGVFSVYASISNNNPRLEPLFDQKSEWDRNLRPQELRPPIAGFLPIPFGSIGPSDAARSLAKPQSAVIEVLGATATRIELRWSDGGALPWQRAIGTKLLEQDHDTGAWRELCSFGPDCNFASVEGLSPSSTHSFRVETYNSAGVANSNSVSATTRPEPPAFGDGMRFEAESPLEIVRDTGAKATISSVVGPQISGKCVTLFEPGDTIRISFTVPSSGSYRIGVRVRSGAANLPIGTEYWPNGYKFKLDGSSTTLKGDPSSVSQMTQLFGPTYWGTMYSEGTVLSEGAHEIEVASGAKWAAVDYMELGPILPRGVASP
jgi:hypothetical protein